LDGRRPGHVDHRHGCGERDVGGEHRALADEYALGEDAARTYERSVLDDHGPRLDRLEHTAEAHATGEVHIGDVLSTRADCRPRVDHRVRPDPRTDVDVARHHYDAGRKVRAIPRS